MKPTADPGRGRIIVVGASLGGVKALTTFAACMPADFPAPVLVVLHIGAHRSAMARIMSRAGPLPARDAEDGDIMQAGHIHLAPGDHHLLVEGGSMRLSRAPKEHHARPAIDPLFRSAALAHGPGVIGVVFTGLLDDGTAGLRAIKACGGTAVVQDPRDAVEPSMPSSALTHASVDHCAPLADIPSLLSTLARSAPAEPFAQPPGRERHEHDILLAREVAMRHLSEIATPSSFVCPDCHGGLWELQDVTPSRFRCRAGHAFTLRGLLHAQALGTDEALRNAMRALQEKQHPVERLAHDAHQEGADIAHEADADAGWLAGVPGRDDAATAGGGFPLRRSDLPRDAPGDTPGPHRREGLICGPAHQYPAVGTHARNMDPDA